MSANKYSAIIISVMILISLTVFLAMNYDALFNVVKIFSLQNELIALMFLSAICLCISILGFKENKRSILIGMLFPLLFLLFSVTVHVLYIFYYPSPAFSIPNILQMPIEQIPLNGGWIGFILILIDGFLLSCVLVRDGVDITERLLLSIGLGFGFTYVVMILIGILWEISLLTIFLTQVILLITLSIAAFFRGLKLNFKSYPRIQKKNLVHISKFDFLKVILLIIISIYVIVAIYQTAAYPDVEWDSLAYGVNYAKIIFERSRIPLIAGPSIGLEMSANYPPGVQLLSVYLYVLAGNVNDFYYRILQPIFGLATMVATYKFVMLVNKNKTAAIFAVFILSVIPTFWELFIYEAYLMCLTLMLTLSSYFFFKAYNSNNLDARKYEIIGTLFCSFAALTSYIGIFSFGILLLYAMNRRLDAKRFFWLVILASIVILPWYMRNFLLLGNPVYPFFGIGNYLDPLLRNSTAQDFQNWFRNPPLDLIGTICKFIAGGSLLAIVYLTYAKRKHFLAVLPLYLLFVGTLIMAVHLPFSRYLIMAIPALAIILSTSIRSLLTTHNLVGNITATIMVLLVLISSVAILPYINSIKPVPAFGNDKWNYLSQVLEEADAWKWINENTLPNDRIATYDIKTYYIERDTMPLDGNESIPLYKMDTIEESINFLKGRNVTYILSVPWATPSDTLLPAYEWCVLTRYLGDPRYLPPVYVSSSGTAIYHVGAMEEKEVYASFSQEGFAPPIKHVRINLTITNETCPPSGKFYIPIPVDYREGLMMASVNSCTHLVNVELWKGIIPENMSTNQLEKPELVKEWPIQYANNSGVENPSFVWQVDRAGYFTFLITDQEETFRGSFNVTVDIRFYNYWDIKSLFIPQGLETYNITASDETFPLMKALYVQVNEPSILSINSTTFNKKICLEIFNGLVPNNSVINWSEQYEMVKWQPNFNDSGEVNPSIQNMFLPYGKYSILVIYKDNYTEQANISLEVKFTSLR
jgi:hypothetical protein